MSSNLSEGIISLHSTESDEHTLIQHVDETVSAFSNLQKLIDGISATVKRTVQNYDLKLYVYCLQYQEIFVLFIQFSRSTRRLLQKFVEFKEKSMSVVHFGT